MVKCPPGYIIRKGYYRGNTYVSATCIKDLGTKGKGAEVIGKLSSGDLIEFGYELKARQELRQQALAKAIKKYGALKTFQKVHALTVLFKRTHPSYATRAKKDTEWISKNYLKK